MTQPVESAPQPQVKEINTPHEKTVTTFRGRKIKINLSMEQTADNFQKMSINALADPITSKLKFVRNNLSLIQESFKVGPNKENKELKKASSKIIRALYDDILALTKQPPKKLTPKDFETIDEGLSFIAEVDSKTSKACKKIFNTCLKNQQRIAKSQNKPLGEQITPPPSDHANVAQITLKQSDELKEQSSYEKEMLNILDKVLSAENQDDTVSAEEGEKKSATITQPEGEDQKKIEEFLVYAYGNEELNKKLRKKPYKTNAEEFISEYTFATMTPKNAAGAKIGPTAIRETLHEVRSTLDKHNLRKACDALRDIEETERTLFGCMTLLDQKKTAQGAAACIKNFFDEYDTQQHKSIWEIRRSPELIQKAKKIQAELEGLNLQGDNIKDDLKKAIAELGKFTKTMEECNEKIEAFLKADTKKLSYLTLSNLKKFDALADLLEPIKKQGDSIAEGSILSDLLETCTEAEDLMYDIRLLADVTNAHQPGDVALKDEVLYKNFIQSTGIPFSQPYLIFKLNPLQTLANLKKFIDDLMNKGFWSLAAFTGPEHARMFFPAAIVNSSSVAKVKTREKKKKKKIITVGDEFVLSQTQKTLSEKTIKNTKIHHVREMVNKLQNNQKITKLTKQNLEELTKIITQAQSSFTNEKVTRILGDTIQTILGIRIEDSKAKQIQEIQVALDKALNHIMTDEQALAKILSDELTNIKKNAMYTTSIPRTIEITGVRGADIGPLDIEQSLYEMHYRPNFDKILTSEAKKKGITKEEAEQIYRQKLQECVEGNIAGNEKDPRWEQIQKYQIDQARAARSFVMSWVPRLGPLNLKKLSGDLFTFLFSREGILRPIFDRSLSAATTKDEAQKALLDANKRFCSELAAEIMKEALDRTEAVLKFKHAMTKPCLHTIFPKEIDPSEIYPGMLAQMMSKSNYFEKIGPPKILTQLFGEVPSQFTVKA